MAHHEENPEKLDVKGFSGFFFVFLGCSNREQKGANTTQKEQKSRIKSRIKTEFISRGKVVYNYGFFFSLSDCIYPTY